MVLAWLRSKVCSFVSYTKKKADLLMNGRGEVQVGSVYLLDGKAICIFVRVRCPR